MTPASCTPVPSSVKILTPSAASSPMGAKHVPARPTVMAPATATRHRAVSPRARTSRATAALSMGGFVLGMASTAV